MDFCGFETVVEENQIINSNEAYIRNNSLDNAIKEEIKDSDEDEEWKFHVKNENIDVEYKDEYYQKSIECEDLIIKHEYEFVYDSVIKREDEPVDGDVCPECTVIVVVNDNPIVTGTANRAAQTVPKGTLALTSSNIYGLGIYSLRHLEKGVRFGPYEGHTDKVESKGVFRWKISQGKLVDGSDETSSNYLRYVNYATDASEQNLVAIQCKGELYYRTSRSIEKNEELLIYFDENPGEGYYEPQEENLDEEFYMCQFCQLGFKLEVHRDRHQIFCRIRTSESHFGSLCKHFAALSDRKCAQIEFLASTKKYANNSWSCDANQKRVSNRGKRASQIQCSGCNSESCQKSNVSRDKMGHYQKTTFKCAHCDFKTCYKQNLKKHEQKHNITNMLKCTDCRYETYSIYNLVRHKLIHDFKNVFECTNCDYKTHVKASLTSHNQRHNKKKMLKCAYCDYVSYSKFQYNNHRQNHEQNNLFACTSCNYKTHVEAYFIRHNSRNHDTKNLYKCMDCDYETHHKLKFNNHRLKHEPNSLFECTNCEYKTHIKNYLTEHKKRKHGQKHGQKNLFKCTNCEYQTYVKSYLIRHNKRRHGWKHGQKHI